MLSVLSCVIHKNIPFEDYLKMDGYSHSFLKREIGGVNPVFEGSDKVKFGSLVDSILTEPEKVNVLDPNYRDACNVAHSISNFIGTGLQHLEKQISFSGNLTNGVLSMPIKGRLDLFGIGRVFDLKITYVSIEQIDTLIDFMGYRNQMFLYCLGLNVKKATLIIYSVKSKKIVFRHFDFNAGINLKRAENFFNDKLLKFGI